MESFRHYGLFLGTNSPGFRPFWLAVESDQGYDAKAAEWHKKLDDYKAATATPPATAKPEPGK